MKISAFKVNFKLLDLNNLSNFESILLRNIISSIFYFGNNVEKFGYENFQLEEEFFIEIIFSLNNKNYELKDFFSSKTKFYNKKSIKELSKEIEKNNYDLINKIHYINHSSLFKNVICYYSINDFNEYSNLITDVDKKYKKNSLFKGFVYFNCLNSQNKFTPLKFLVNHYYGAWFELKYIKKNNNSVLDYYDNFFNLIFSISKDFGYKISINYSKNIIFYNEKDLEINLDSNFLNDRTYLLILDLLFKSFKLLDLSFNINNLNPLIILKSNNLINEESLKKYIPNVQIIKENN